MPAARRDYVLDIIEQIARLLAQAITKRKAGQTRESLQTIVQSCERLFGMESRQLFEFTPDQHFALLAKNETPENARAKILVYAALNVEAAELYATMGKPELARASRLNALRLSLRARESFGRDDLPTFAPDVTALLAALADAPLDADTEALIGRVLAPSASRGSVEN